MNENTDKKPSKRKYKLAVVIVLLLLIFAVFVYALLTQEPKPDPASEAVILKQAAFILDKDTNGFTKED